MDRDQLRLSRKTLRLDLLLIIMLLASDRGHHRVSLSCLGTFFTNLIKKVESAAHYKLILKSGKKEEISLERSKSRE